MLLLTSLPVLLLFSCIKYANTIRCYECTSVNNSMCLDPTIYDQDTVTRYLGTTNCETGVYSAGNKNFFCRKIVQTILHKGHDPEVRVTRGCGWMRHNRDCYKADNEDHLETVCQCFTNECNAGVALGYSSGIVLILGLLVLCF